jgi:hypothetical protein
MDGAAATIIAGRFEEQDRAQAALRTLTDEGFPEGRSTCFFVNPPGHHDRYPIGGDQDESPGATHADSGALKGAGIGGAIGLGAGLAAAPLAGPAAVAAGAGVGAYVGALAGALGGMGNRHMPLRKSGFLTAVRVDDPAEERSAVRVLQAAGACEIERAEGHLEAGEWTDFDATRPPHLVGGLTPSA